MNCQDCAPTHGAAADTMPGVTRTSRSRPPPGGVLLVDASAYLFRAWFGVPDVFADHRGRPLNAVVGFARTLARLLAEARPAAVAIAFDESLFSGFRHRLDPGYKSSRVLPDEDLAWQMQACRLLAERLGLRAVASREYEADDLLATLAARVAAADGFSVLAGEDKDLAQALAGPHDLLWQVARDRLLGRDDVGAWLGISPERLPELQALTGDPVDDVPGIPGVGPRTALALLAHCRHVEELLAQPGQVAALPLRGAGRLAGLLAEHAPRVRLNLRLVTLSRRATGLPRVSSLRFRPAPAAQVDEAVASLGLPAGSARALRAAMQQQE